jgi:hypothetical protein
MRAHILGQAQSDLSSKTRSETTPLVECGVAANLVQRLAAKGIHTAADWRGLGTARFRIFGVTRVQADGLDELVRRASRNTSEGR